MGLEQDAIAELRELAAMHRLRVPRVVDGAQGAIAVDRAAPGLMTPSIPLDD